MRGTEQLAPDQRPGLRKTNRKFRGRAQPYRRRRRHPGPTLDAMLKGEPFYLPNPADFRRRLQRQIWGP